MNKRLKVCLIVVVILVVVIILDTLQAVAFNNGPFLRIRYYIDGGTTYYIDKGLIVNHYYCSNDEEHTLVKGSKYFCPKPSPTDLEVKEIVDTTKDLKDFVCNLMLEEFYKDDSYVYYFNCIKSDYVLVRYTNGYEETVEDALKNGTIKVEDLDAFDIEYTTVEIVNDNLSCINSLLEGYITTEIYEIDEVKITDLIDANLANIDYSFVGKSEVGIYVILKTNDDNIVQDLDKYFDEKYNGYQSTIYNGYKIYIYNKINDFDLLENLDSCIS